MTNTLEKTQMKIIREYVCYRRDLEGITFTSGPRPEFSGDCGEAYGLLYQQLIPADYGWEALDSPELRQRVIQEICQDKVYMRKKIVLR